MTASLTETQDTFTVPCEHHIDGGNTVLVSLDLFVEEREAPRAGRGSLWPVWALVPGKLPAQVGWITVTLFRGKPRYDGLPVLSAAARVFRVPSNLGNLLTDLPRGFKVVRDDG